GVGGAHLHAQLAELAGVELEREGLGVVSLLTLEHLDFDHRGWADELAQPAADAGFLAGVLLVDEGEQAAVAIRIGPLLVRIVHGHRLAEQVEQRHPHRLRDRANDEQRAGVRSHRPSRRPRTTWRRAASAWPAARISTTGSGSDRRGCGRSSSGST